MTKIIRFVIYTSKEMLLSRKQAGSEGLSKREVEAVA